MLYLQDSYIEASPKAISGRTSYLRVRLAFLRYPQLIPGLFNVRGFGPPLRFTAASTWPWIGHPVSGLRLRTYSPYSDSLSLRLRLIILNLARKRNSPVHSTKSTPSHIECAPTACRHTVSGSISLPFRGSFHLSLTVLVHYRSPGSI